MAKKSLDPVMVRLRQVLTELAREMGVGKDSITDVVDHCVENYEASVINNLQGLVALSILDLHEDDEDEDEDEAEDGAPTRRGRG